MISTIQDLAQNIRRSPCTESHTVVFPVPPVPAIEVISPYLKPPSRAASSMPVQPELAGGGTCFTRAFAAVCRAEPRSPGAAW